MQITVQELNELNFHHKGDISIVRNASGTVLTLPYEYYLNKVKEILNVDNINLANGGNLTHTES